MTPPSAALGTSEPTNLATERALVSGLKKLALAVLGTAMQTYGEKMGDEQEALSFTADIIIEAYGAESALLRALQAVKDDAQRAELHAAAARIAVHTAASRAEAAAREAFAAMTTGDNLRILLAATKRWLKATPANLVADRRVLAGETGQRKKYVFDVL